MKKEGGLSFEEFVNKYVSKFDKIYFLFYPDKGFIVWKLGTGENVELLHIRSFKHRQGIGMQLIQGMVNELRKNPPYYSIFGFTLASNSSAISFYKKAGFELSPSPFPYKTDGSMIFCQSFEKLCKLFPDEPSDLGEMIKSKSLEED